MARATVANLPRAIALREIAALQRELGWDDACCEILARRDSPCPGNVMPVEIESEHIREVFTSFGERALAHAATSASSGGERGRRGSCPLFSIELSGSCCLKDLLAPFTCSCRLSTTRRDSARQEPTACHFQRRAPAGFLSVLNGLRQLGIPTEGSGASRCTLSCPIGHVVTDARPMRPGTRIMLGCLLPMAPGRLRAKISHDVNAGVPSSGLSTRTLSPCATSSAGEADLEGSRVRGTLVVA